MVSWCGGILQKILKHFFFTVVAPLTDLLKGKVKFIWSPVCQKAFENVKTILSVAPLLAAPQRDQPFTLQVEAGDVGEEQA